LVSTRRIATALPLARLICQRANCWWDAHLRRKYSFGLKVILVAVTIAVVMFGVESNRTLGQLVLSVIAPLSPALLWGIREIRKQDEAAEALDKLRSQVEQTWESALRGAVTSEAAEQISIAIQNEIFDRRSRHPLIFNWINRLARSKQPNEHEREGAGTRPGGSERAESIDLAKIAYLIRSSYG